jgi:hypothetical protein
MEFTATLELHGKTATGILVPEEVVTSLAGGGRPAVTVTLTGAGRSHTYRSTIASRGAAHWLPVSAENRAPAALSAGDTVRVEVTLDTAKRVVTPPKDLAAALAADPEAAAAFAGLAPSYQKAYVTWVESAKQAETRARRVSHATVRLRAGDRQP